VVPNTKPRNLSYGSVTKLIKRLLMYFGRKTHDVRIQLLCATLYGLVSMYGIGGGIAIILKARKLAKPRKVVKK
jgi:hypothetical protein